MRVSAGFQGSDFVPAPPVVFAFLLPLQVPQTLHDGWAAHLKIGKRVLIRLCDDTGRGVKRWLCRTYTHESSQLCDQFVLRCADEAVGGAHGTQLT